MSAPLATTEAGAALMAWSQSDARPIQDFGFDSFEEAVALVEREARGRAAEPWQHEPGEPPKRIQRKRTKGWRMPEGAVYVGRPSRWGNRWRVDEPLGRALLWDPATVVELFRIDARYAPKAAVEAWVAPLRGHDLACWCPLDQPCHADVLLELANR